jgi:hypothetical protein
MTTQAPPRHLPPTVHDARPYLPDVLGVQCFSPIGDRPRQREGTTDMGFERKTVVRHVGESDAALWQRVQHTVTHFKDRYGWNQPVAVVCDYDSTREQGMAQFENDGYMNLIAALRYAVGNSTDQRVRFVAGIALSQLNAWHRVPLP